MVEKAALPDGVIVQPLTKRADARGHLIELFRADELPEGFLPQMAYLSVTLPGIARGPHEHRDQTDGFAFLNGRYELRLWENRGGRDARSVVLEVGEENPVFVVVPPGVVHGYRNVGDRPAYVLNAPDRLYAGPGRREPVDEIRHEEESDARFSMTGPMAPATGGSE